MNRFSKLTIIAALAAAATVRLQAAQTNLVQNINMTITAYAEGDTVTNGTVVTRPVMKLKATSKNIVQLLGEAMGVTFSTGAKLLLINPLPDGESSIVVQDGTNRVVVSAFFDASDSGTSVEGFSRNTLTGTEKGTHISIFELELRDNGQQVLSAHFHVAGLATDTSASIVKSGVILGESHSTKGTLAGTGDFTDDLGSHPMMVQMVLSTSGNKIEVLP